MVSVGLLGCGRWGKFILRDLKVLGAHVSVLAVDAETHLNAKLGGADLIVATFEELPNVDAYVVAVPTQLHAEFVLRLIAKNKPVFCEKPLTNDVNAARQIVREAGDRVFVMDKWRYHDGVLALKKIADSGELGPVLGIKTTRVQWGCPHDDVEMDWILLPHDLTIALEILGFIPEPCAAVAEVSSAGLIGLSGILHSDGIWVQFEVGIRSPQHTRIIELRCRDGIATLSDAYDESVSILKTKCLDKGEPAPAVELLPLSADMPLLKELKVFLDFVETKTLPPRSSAAEGLQVVERITKLRQLAGIDV